MAWGWGAVYDWYFAWPFCGISLAYPLEHNSEGKSLSHNQDICIRLLGQSEWLGGDVELSDQFNEQIII